MPRLCLQWSGYDSAGHPQHCSLWFADTAALVDALTQGLEWDGMTLHLTEDVRQFPPGVWPFAAGTLGCRER